MNAAPLDLTWPIVSEAGLDGLLRSIAYRRSAWSDAVVYDDSRTGARLAFILEADGRARINPRLLED